GACGSRGRRSLTRRKSDRRERRTRRVLLVNERSAVSAVSAVAFLQRRDAATPAATKPPGATPAGAEVDRPSCRQGPPILTSPTGRAAHGRIARATASGGWASQRLAFLSAIGPYGNGASSTGTAVTNDTRTGVRAWRSSARSASV